MRHVSAGNLAFQGNFLLDESTGLWNLVELSTNGRRDHMSRRLSGISVDNGLWLSNVPRSTDRCELCCYIPVDFGSQGVSRILRMNEHVRTLITFDDIVSPYPKIKICLLVRIIRTIAWVESLATYVSEPASTQVEESAAVIIKECNGITRGTVRPCGSVAKHSYRCNAYHFVS